MDDTVKFLAFIFVALVVFIVANEYYNLIDKIKVTTTNFIKSVHSFYSDMGSTEGAIREEQDKKIYKNKAEEVKTYKNHNITPKKNNTSTGGAWINKNKNITTRDDKTKK